MVALIPEARQARDEARRLRVESLELKLSLRASAARSHEEIIKARAAVSRVQARRSTPLPSPWSALGWTYYDEDVDRTLVLLPPP